MTTGSRYGSSTNAVMRHGVGAWLRGSGQWWRSYGNELWEFDDGGLMRRCEASINDVAIDESDRRYFGPRPDDERGHDFALH